MFHHLARPREEAWRAAAEGVHHFLGYDTERRSEHADFNGLQAMPGGAFFGVDPLTPPAQSPRVDNLHLLGSPLVVGTPADAIRDLERSMRLYAREIMPRLRANQDARAPSPAIVGATCARRRTPVS